MNYIKAILVFMFMIICGDAWSQSCTVSTIAVNFGSYIISDAAPSDATGNVDVTCDPGIPYTVKLDAGQNSGGGFNPRKMQLSDGVDTLNYNLYRDSAKTEVWGDGTGNTYVQTRVGSGGTAHLTVYGSVPAGQNVRAGLYTDAVTVILEW